MSLAMPLAAPTIPNRMPNVAPFFNGNGEARDSRETAAERGPAANYERPIGAWTINNDHHDVSANAGPAAASTPPGPVADDFNFSVHSNGNLHDAAVGDSDRHTAVAIHLSPLAFFWIGPFALAIPLVLWLVRKDHSRFAADHGKETLNFLLSFVVLHVLLAVTIIGLALWPVLWVVSAVNVVRGSMAASRGEYFRYPVTIRFL